MDHEIPQGRTVEANFYDGYEHWKGWDKLFSFDDEKASYFAGETKGLAISKGAAVLEIGFGSGAFLEWARKQGAQVAGTEINPVLQDAARTRGIELLPADIECVAARYAARFDTIVAFDVFEHFALDEVVTRLAAVETMLKPGGSLLMRFPNAQSPFGLAPQNGDPTHKCCLSLSVFEQLLQGRSLGVVRYSHQYRVPGLTLGRQIVRFVRYRLQDVISGFLNFVYVSKIPHSAVAVLVLRKD